MAKAAHGIADDLFSTTLLATTAPIVVAPAMNVHMYENAATQTNMETLKTRGFHFVEADDGYLACGDASLNQNVSFLPSLICSMERMKSKTTLQASA